MRGNDIVKMLKAEDKLKAVPIMILSNFGQNELIQEAMNLGAVDYILKYQIEPADLVAKVKAVLKEKAPLESKMPEDPIVGQQ
jgi:DNA-binding response OmpR family regulator